MKHLLFAIAFAYLAQSIPAQEYKDFGKDRLNSSPRHGEWVDIKSGDRTIKAFVVYPERKDKAPAVLVIQEIFGLTDWVRAVADQLAEAGYVAIAPDLLSGAGPNGGGTAELAANDGVRKAINSLPAAQVTTDLDAVADYVKALPACNGKLVVRASVGAAGKRSGTRLTIPNSKPLSCSTAWHPLNRRSSRTFNVQFTGSTPETMPGSVPPSRKQPS